MMVKGRRNRGIIAARIMIIKDNNRGKSHLEAALLVVGILYFPKMPVGLTKIKRRKII